MPHWAAQGRVNLGWAMAGQGRLDEGIQHLEEGMAGLRTIGTRAAFTYFEGALAEAQLRRRSWAAARAALDRGLAFAAETDERYYLPELHRLHGELRSAEGDPRGAQAAFADALALANDQGAGTFAARAEAGLATLERAAVR